MFLKDLEFKFNTDKSILHSAHMYVRALIGANMISSRLDKFSQFLFVFQLIVLNRIQHKHIVQFLGAVTDEEHFKAIVLGWFQK